MLEKRDSRGERQQTLAICFMEKCHYVLISVDPTAETIAYYDSMNRHKNAEVDMMKMNMAMSTDVTKHFTMQHVIVARQKDGISCGLYSLLNFSALIHNNSPPAYIEVGQLERVRRYFFKIFYKPEFLLDTVLKIRKRTPSIIGDELFEEFLTEMQMQL